MDLSFAVHKLAKLSANPGKVHLEELVHLFRYIRENKTLGLKYYADMNDAPVTDLLRQASIKTDNHLMAFYRSIHYLLSSRDNLPWHTCRFTIQDNQRSFLWNYVWILVQKFMNQHSEMC